jgi:hypothetical protein
MKSMFQIGVRLVVMTGLLTTTSNVGMAAEEEPLFCTVNGDNQCVFANGNYWAPCPENIAEGTRLLGLVAAQTCGTIHVP